MAYFIRFFSILAFVGITQTAHSAEITEEMIADKNAAMEKALQNRADFHEMIRFLHEHISKDAVMEVTVSNPLSDNGQKTMPVKMNKTDYINSYVQSWQYIRDYEVRISTKDVYFDESTGNAVSTDIMTETGIMASAEGTQGRPFTSRTKCTTEHTLESDTLTSLTSVCHTDISYLEDI